MSNIYNPDGFERDDLDDDIDELKWDRLHDTDGMMDEEDWDYDDDEGRDYGDEDDE